jgi:hypothetical protein
MERRNGQAVNGMLMCMMISSWGTIDRREAVISLQRDLG